jgi:hypothetical protein
VLEPDDDKLSCPVRIECPNYMNANEKVMNVTLGGKSKSDDSSEVRRIS